MEKINGFINIYKPKGISSTKLVAMAKKILNIKKIGHTGTLDPLAEGVLPLAIGEATKLSSLLVDAKKQYEFIIQFGEKTSTGDVEGEVLERCISNLQEKDLKNVLVKFIGEITQTPSKYSAIKINGKRAYDLARKGEEFEMPSRKINIYELELLKFDEKNQKARLICSCSKGTYIRSLAEDIAFSLQNYGVVVYLRRNKVGNFNLQNSVALEDKFFDDLEFYSKKLSENILPVDILLDDILVIDASEETSRKIRFGQKCEFNFRDESLVAVKANNKLIAIGEIHNKIFVIKRVFNL